ncbi:MAG: hypothetical protein BSR46_12145 [Candidatus Dactylopiibacterium carminicum]|nr:rhomboid family intramembrane serine protease [Candidatus Dactylopiibacterium carminicum]PAS98390.1 MAG: hypothetical protein BSR46_12145 [Candidatus Dactylopiibacterium carminicum]
MLMMPYVSRITRARFPVAVLLLVLINLFVYFVLQARDEQRYELLGDYYASSVLPGIEFPAYAQWLGRQAETAKLVAFEEARRRDGFAALHMLEADSAFQQALRNGDVLPEQDARRADWKRARGQFEAMRAQLFTERFAFDASHPSWLTAITHQFLHGSRAHLVGNMVVLILIAPAVEALVGSTAFLTIYLLGGLVAAASHMLFAGAAAGSLVGASGAISAAMGAFAVLLGRRRIPFFYFVVVYFDVIRAPALLALPLWMANELVQFFWFGDRQVAYGAHFGGLLAGALLAFPLRARAMARLARQDAADVTPINPTGRESENLPWAPALRDARRLMTAQRFDEARRAYGLVVRHEGVSTGALRECFNVLRLSPTNTEYQACLSAIFTMDRSAPEQTLVLDAFRDYARNTAAVALPPKVLVMLVRHFAHCRAWRELEQAAQALHAAAPDSPALVPILAKAAHALREGGEPLRALTLTRMISHGDRTP